jgi:hypothetical protein
MLCPEQHIDTLDTATEDLDWPRQPALASHAESVALLCTIPGVPHTDAAQVLIAECGLDVTQFSPSDTSRGGRERVLPSRVSRPPTLRPNPTRATLADRHPDRMRQGRRPRAVGHGVAARDGVGATDPTLSRAALQLN